MNTTTNNEAAGLKLQSFKLIYYQRQFWRICAIRPPDNDKFKKMIYKVYQLIYHSLITAYFPLSLMISFVKYESVRALIEKFAANFTFIMVTVKMVTIWKNMEQIDKIKMISIVMDEKAKRSSDEVEILLKMRRKLKFVMIPYLLLFSMTCISAGLALVFSKERNLLYPAYFPFDWNTNDLVYKAVVFYQWIGLCLQCYSSLFLDTFYPLAILLLTTHLNVLGARISKIGWNHKKSKDDNYQDLMDAIADHKKLLQFYTILHDIVSPAMFGMILVTALNLCASIIMTLFFAENVIQKIYFFVYGAGLPLQICFACYFGTAFELECAGLCRSIYFCNWMDQTKQFKLVLQIFVETSLRKKQFVAGGVLVVSLVNFLQVMKSSYSLYAVLNQMRG